MEKKEKEKSKRDAIYIIIIILLLAGGGYLGWTLGEHKKQINACSQSVTNLEEEKDYLNNILQQTGIIDDAADKNLEDNLKNMLSEYDNMEIKNSDMLDSINSQKAHIQELLTEVETMKNQKKRDWGKIYKLQKESETLRKIMKGYIHTIDSLNTLNVSLKNTIKDKDDEIVEISTDRDNIKNENETLQETVAKGSVLQTSGISALAIKIKSSGKQVETTRANRADMIKSCFTIMENKIAKPGNKDIYMRIIAPNGQEMTNTAPVLFEMDGGREGTASVKRQVNYQNQNMDLCIYYEFENELEEGTYIVEIYAEGHKIGKSSFALK